MTARTLGVVLPYWLGRPETEALPIAREAAATGFDRLWIGEMATFDAFALATAIGLQTPSLRLTVGPLAVGVRSPVALALGLASVATLTGSQVGLALGASSPEIVTGWHDRGWPGNPRRMAESVTVLRELFAGRRADFSGEYVRTHGFKLRRPQPAATISVAAFGPRMTRTAAEVADEVVLNLVAPEHVARVRAVVDTIADAAGRDRPRLAVWVAASIEPGPAALAQLAAQLAVYLAPPGYGEMFAELGFGELVAKARGGGLRRDELARRIPLDLPRAVGATGSGDEVLDRLRAYFAAGADHLGIVPVTADDPGGSGTLAFVRANVDRLAAALR